MGTPHPEPEAAWQAVADGDCCVIPVIADVLTLEKRWVDAGANLRIRKVVGSATVTVETPLASESVKVERIPKDLVVSGFLPVRFDGDVLVVSRVEERPMLQMQHVLVEEIRVTRSTTTTRFSKTVTVRKDDVILERLDPATGQWSKVEAGAGIASA